jgi:hypothetical protein
MVVIQHLDGRIVTDVQEHEEAMDAGWVKQEDDVVMFYFKIQGWGEYDEALSVR